MEKLLRDTLILLELTPIEIRFFEACFVLGPCTITEAAKKGRLERSTAYLITQTLIQKGFITEDLKQYKKILIAIEPSKLLRMLASKQRTMQKQEMELEENLAQLQAIYKASDILPKVKVYQGTKGLLSIWEDLLLIKQELLLWTNQETESLFFTPTYHTKFIEHRVKKDIPTRVLAIHNEKGKLLQISDKANLRETRLLPKNMTFSAETYIYGNKIAILDYKKDIFGITIESEPIATTQRTIFELTWQTTKS